MGKERLRKFGREQEYERESLGEDFGKVIQRRKNYGGKISSPDGARTLTLYLPSGKALDMFLLPGNSH